MTHPAEDGFGACLAPGWARLAQLVIAGTGIGLTVWTLDDPQRNWRLRAALIAAVLIVWMLAVVAWLPALPQQCEN